MGTIWNLMMKMNMPTEDAQVCMRELGERSMGNWFENMDKMDIQAERQNTAEARRELAEVKEKLAELEQESEKTKNQAAISIINMTKKYSDTKEAAVLEVAKAININEEEAERLVERYW